MSLKTRVDALEGPTKLRTPFFVKSKEEADELWAKLQKEGDCTDVIIFIGDVEN